MSSWSFLSSEDKTDSKSDGAIFGFSGWLLLQLLLVDLSPA